MTSPKLHQRQLHWFEPMKMVQVQRIGGATDPKHGLYIDRVCHRPLPISLHRFCDRERLYQNAVPAETKFLATTLGERGCYRFCRASQKYTMIELDFAMQKADQLTFGEVALDVIERGGRIWLCDEQIGRALGYVRPAASVYQLYKRFADEFLPGMMEMIHVRQHGRRRQMRIFTPRGCHLLAMFAKTPTARDFRKWLTHVFDEDALRLMPPTPLTPEQQRAVQKKVADRVYELYGGARGQGFAAIYHAIKDEFNVGSYRQVAKEQFEALMQFISHIEPQPIEMPPQLATRAAVVMPSSQQPLPHPYGYLQGDWALDPLWQLIQQQKARGENMEKYELMYKANRKWMSLASAVLSELAQQTEAATMNNTFGGLAF